MACAVPGGAGPQEAADLGAVLPAWAACPRRTQSLQPGVIGEPSRGMSAKLTRAVRLELPGHDQLKHFIAGTAWDDSAVWTVLARKADRLVGGPDAFLVIDDTALPRQGRLSVGVARQYYG